MTRYLAYALLVLLGLSAPLRAAEDDSRGLLVGFLEDTLSGDSRTVKVKGLQGALSSRATIEELTVSDDDGIWLTMRGAVLDWNRLALLRGRFSVNTLSAEEIVIARRPGTTTTPTELPSPETAPFRVPELPVAIELGEIRVGRLKLGEPVLGISAELEVDGRLSLADGALDASLSIARLDRASDAIRLAARFDNSTRQIALDLTVTEGPGGLISAALELPGRPPLNLTARGEGPVNDFSALVALASGGETRLSGQVQLQSADATGQDIAFAADLGGDLTPLLPEAYRDFFGTDAQFSLTGVREAAGRLEVSRFALRSDALRLAGRFAMNARGTVETVTATGSILPARGDEVILPVSGARTAIASARFALDYDLAAGRGWTLDLNAEKLRNATLSVQQARISASGPVAPEDGSVLKGRIAAALSGMRFADAALAAAAGDEVALAGGFAVTPDRALRLSGMALSGTDYDAEIDGRLSGFGSGFAMEGKARVAADDLARFSALAGRPLGGAASIGVSGTATVMSGAFDFRAEARARDLTAGIERLDPLIAGETVLTLDATRGPEGVTIRAFSLQGSALSANARGRLRSGASVLTFDARLADLASLIEGAEGPLTLAGEMRQSGPLWDGRVRLDGPTESFAELTGSVDKDGAGEVDFRAELARLERFIPNLTGALTAGGSATRERDGKWTILADAEGPAGISAKVDGTLDEVTGRADLSATGQARLDLVNLFISPNTLEGMARFDLRLAGTPSLDGLSGEITVADATLAVPALLQRMQNLSATVTISDSRATVLTTGTLGAGGSFRLSGPIGLRPPFDSRLTLELAELGLTDNLSVTSSASGQIVFAGPLTGNGSLSGQVIFGETDINLNRVSGAVGAPPIPPLLHEGEPAPVRATRSRAGLIAEEEQGNIPVIALDLRLAARDRVFVHGFGLTAEMGGDMTLRGTTEAVVPSGQITLKRGAIDLVGRKVKLTKGTISLQGNLQPYVDFESTTSTSEGQATFRISGPLNAPEIDVFADPERPAEEALAMLLFGNRTSELSPLVIAQMAASLTQMRTGESLAATTGRALGGGKGNGGGLARLLSGGYIARNVYTDFTVNTRGETELNLNLDVSDSVTMKGTVDNSGNTGVGVFFERDY